MGVGGDDGERMPQPSAEEWSLLREPAAPIVLLDKAGAALPDALAPGQAALGWMLPYTPLHHLLLDAVDRPLVMTSGNLSGEPQVIGNAEARDEARRLRRRRSSCMTARSPGGSTIRSSG